ncbi:adenosylmethionine decarboxylase [Lewinella sp. IMCC34183]|uniref:adenosylmethionine decarboxylase n=1 Tax=Lewinella sp. IMCC34183 TaxID=2248762 RepID=UPI000E22B7C5|nr:adenosylmethionine decarboxylase [Lewinella sp. IMCC34183]
MVDYLGIHILLELHGCPPERLRRPVDSERILLAAAAAMRARVVESRFHAFSPHGVSGVVVIAESHLTVHTWPEHGYAAVDVFSCGQLDLEAGLAILQEGYAATDAQQRRFGRGRVPTPPQ